MGLGPLATAKALGGPVSYLGGRWMTDRDTYSRGAELGVAGGAFYFLGRGAALGDVSGEVVASAMTFFPVPVVTAMWEQGRGIMQPAAALAAFSECCWAWAAKKLTPLADSIDFERLSQLLAAVVDGADASMLTLFVGWRNAARPAEAPARAAQLLHVLRELRGGVHAVAVRASGMTAVEAIATRALGATTGRGAPQTMGWPEPLPECTPELLERRREVEELTDQLMAAAFAGIGENDRQELVDRVGALSTALKIG